MFLQPKLGCLPLLANLLINLLDLCRADYNVNVLDSPEFVVKARVRFVRQDTDLVDGEAEITEYCSNRFLRSRIEILKLSAEWQHKDSQQQYATYYYWSSSGGEQLIRETEDDCARVDRRQFYTDLFSLNDKYQDFSSISDSWLNADNQTLNPHIIGVSKFLSDLQHGIGKPTMDPYEKSVRNMKAVKYNYSLKKPDTRSEDVLNVYYQRTDSTIRQPDPMKDIPLRLWFLLQDGTEIIIDYMAVAQFQDLEYLNNDGLNRFALPVNAKCVKDSPVVNPTKFMGDIQSMSFLFQRITNNPPVSPRSWEFVAFDKLSKALRVDRLRERKIASTRAMFLVTITDLKLKRRFFIRQFRGHDYSEANRCIASSYHPELMSDLPLPLDRLIKLGPAKVRGVETVAYASLILPEILYPSNQYEAEGDFIHEPQKLRNCGKDNCLVVYYFSLDDLSTDTKLGQLLRIDIVDDETLIERLEVQQFAFELLDAPNGDSRNSLFSIRDRCRNNVTSLPINFALDMKLNMDSSTPIAQVPATLNYLSNPSKMSRELQRSLVSGTNLNAANMYDLMVEPVSRTNEFLVRIRAKLANLNEVSTYEIRFVGTGNPRHATRQARASDWDTCFFMSSRPVSDEAIPTFSFCYSTCLLDWNKSNLKAAEQTDAGQCRVYEVVKLDRSAVVQDGSYWNNLVEDIQNSHLTLQLDNCKGCAKSVSFEVRRAYINSDEFEDSEQREVSELTKALAGIGLSPEQSAEVLPPQLPEIDKESLEFIAEPEMSLNTCQYSCMSNLACKSYSLCSLPEKLECLISSADIRNSSILGLLSNIQTRDRSITLPWTWRDTLSANAVKRKILSELTLRLDKRCHTYTKRALDVFTRTEKGYLFSAHSTGVDVTAANSRERCARRCLRRNLNFFKQVEVVTRKLEANKRNAPLDQIDHLQAVRKEMDSLMRSWCHHFAFLSRSSLSRPMLEYMQAHTAARKRGYCLLSSSNATMMPEDDSNDKLTSMPLEIGDVRVQEFLYGNLFERFVGLTLDGSSAPGESYKPRSGEDLRATMHLKNWQTTDHQENEEECAKACFLQTSGLKPWCRSFHVLRPDKSARFVLCTYNSLTLADVLAMGDSGAHLLRKLSREEAAHFSHYDQRPEFLFDDYVLARSEVRMSYVDLVVDKEMSGFFRAVAILLVLIVSLATGIFLAIKLSYFVQNRIASARQSDLIQMELPVDDEDDE